MNASTQTNGNKSIKKYERKTKTDLLKATSKSPAAYRSPSQKSLRKTSSVNAKYNSPVIRKNQ